MAVPAKGDRRLRKILNTESKLRVYVSQFTAGRYSTALNIEVPSIKAKECATNYLYQLKGVSKGRITKKD